MSQNQDVNPGPAVVAADGLDPRKVGEILISAGMAAALGGHARPANTMKDYVHPLNPEMAFVRDMFTCSTKEIADVWYGGEFEASVRASFAIASILDPHD